MRRLGALLVLALALAVLAASCGGSDDSSDAEATAAETTAAETTAAETTAEAAAGVPANEWAADVCGALTSWQSEITTGVPDLSDPSDLEATKQAVVDYLDAVSTSTASLVDEVEAAGVPDVDDGEAVATDFRGALSSVQQSFEDAKADVEALSTDDPGTFASGLQEVGTSLQTAGTAAVGAFSDLGTRYPSLNDAVADVPACSSLAGS